MQTKTLSQTYFFKALPVEIYNLLMDQKLHSAFTGVEAKIQDRVGTKFTAWDGYIEGKNLVLEKSKKIVQLWRADEGGWPADHFSTVILEFDIKDDGTILTFTQTDIPEACFDNISQGWLDFYWTKIEEYLELA